MLFFGMKLISEQNISHISFSFVCARSSLNALSHDHALTDILNKIYEQWTWKKLFELILLDWNLGPRLKLKFSSCLHWTYLKSSKICAFDDKMFGHRATFYYYIRNTRNHSTFSLAIILCSPVFIHTYIRFQIGFLICIRKYNN